ncbi:MAG: hypothetical protein JWP88_1731 [Flaviaesturariibacter sp.]|nr:hypothetical protein [Flaviaesturariibacter sp.]
MIALFKQKSPGNVAILLIFGLLLKLPLFLQPKWIVQTSSDGRLYEALVNWLKQSDSALIGSSIAFALLYIQALIINHTVNEYRMMAKQTFLPGMAFLLLTSLVPEWSYLSAPLVASAFLVWGFSKLFELYNAASANTKIYNIGFLLGLASFFYFPSLLFTICILIGLAILRPFRLNEFVLLLLGLLTPFYFLAVYLFLTDSFSISKLIPVLYIKALVSRPSYWLLASIILAGVPFLMGGYYIQTQLRKMLIQARKNWSILLLYVLLAIFTPFVNIGTTYTPWMLAAAPVAAFHACAYLYPPRKWVAGGLFFIMLAFILIQQYGAALWHR